MLDLILTVLLAIVTLVGLGGSVWSYRKGKSDAETRQEIDQHNEYIATRKRIEDAIDASRSDGSDWHDRLRKGAAANKRDL